MSFDPTGQSIDQILDYGAPGLQYWEHFLPLYAKAFGAARGVTLTGLYARYDEQRGTDLAEFDNARAELDKALTDAENRWSAQQAVAQTLPTAWTGATGTEALAIVNSQLRRARDDLDAARTASTTIASALDPLRRAALTKAEVTLALLEPTPDGAGRIAIDGKTPADIATLISDATDPWLTSTFRPDVDRKLTTFAAACETADHTFDSHYRTILTALSRIVDHPYPHPSPALLPQPDPVPNPPTSQPFPASPSHPTPASPPYAATSPNPTVYPRTTPQTAAPEYPPASAEPVSPPDSPAAERRGGSSPATTEPEAQPAQSGSTEPAASGAPAISTTEPATTPESAQPQSDQFTRTLKDALTQLEAGLQRGISTALENLGSLTTPTPDASDTPDDRTDPDPGTDPDEPKPANIPSGHLEFDLAGKHFALDRTPDSDLTLAITDESGRTQTYAVTFGPDGLPSLTPEASVDAQATPHTDSQPDPNPATLGDAGPSAKGGGTPDTPGTSAPDPTGATPPDSTGVSPPPPVPIHPDCVLRTCVTPNPPSAQPEPQCLVPVPDQAATPEIPGSPLAADPPVSRCAEAPQPEAAPDQTPAKCAAPPESAVPPSALPGSAVPLESAGPLESGTPTRPLGDAVPPGAAEPLPGGAEAATTPPNPVPTLGSPDAALEIPEGGVEIPEVAPLAPSAGA